MLLICILAYLGITLIIGISTSRFVKTSEDFILAGRRLPFMLCTTALFATWFGSETILGASAEFSEHGLYGVIEDPFGAALCLLLVGILFARSLYRMKIITFCDFYRNRFGSKVEFVSAVIMVFSYFGWTAAQFVAMGILLNAVTGIPISTGIIVGASIVVIYTLAGGMWAISVTDFMQTIVILGGLLFLLYDISGKAGGLGEAISAVPVGTFRFFPENLSQFAAYMAAWITLGLGAIPSQDIFQRVMSAKDERTAVWSSVASAFMYLSIAFIPMLIILCAKRAYPELTGTIHQMIMPEIVLNHAGLPLQILFFGALLSAVMSTASGAILAPAAILSENLIRPFVGGRINMLFVTRFSVVFIALSSVLMAFRKPAFMSWRQRHLRWDLWRFSFPLLQDFILKKQPLQERCCLW